MIDGVLTQFVENIHYFFVGFIAPSGASSMLSLMLNNEVL